MTVTYMSVNEKFMKINSLQISTPESCTETILIYIIRFINYALIFIFLMQNFIHFYLLSEFDLAKEAMHIVNTFIYIGSIIRITFYIINSKETSYLVQEMQDMFMDEIEIPGGKFSMDPFIKRSNQICYFWHLNVTSATTCMSFIPLLLMLFKHGERY